MSYTVPSGENWFSGTVVYHAEPKAYAPLLIRIWGNDKLLWEKGMRGDGPPVAFSILVIANSRLVIESESTWVTTFYLADAQFSRSGLQWSTTYVPATGAGYVDCAPSPRQDVLGIYHPGESVPVTAYFSGTASQAAVDIHLRPAWGTNSAEVATEHLDIPLKSAENGVVQGSSSWTVPSTQGPAMLHVKESVAGRVVFDRQVRIGIGPKFDLAAESDSFWGVHLSGAGYPLIFDEFGGLWGAKWGRMFLRWPVVESTQGEFDFTRIDRLVEMYRSQNMRILMVIGENAPAWAGSPGTAYYAAWKHFVNAAVRHLASKVDAWEIFNEVDAKYYDALHKFEPDWDVKTMRIAMEAVRANDPNSPTVCCSTVTSSWLAYDRRIFQDSLFANIDVVSLHPYQHGAPEQKDGEFNYSDRLASLGKLERSFGASKPIWATEGNWIIGQSGDRSVPEPDMNEQEQAEYVVRANLLSAAGNVKFFLHSPYAHAHRTEIHVSTWAAYAQMASFFFGASNFKLTQSGPQVFAVTAESSAGQLGVLWTAYGQTPVRLDGGQGYRFFDMYGNPLPINPNSVSISASPIYYEAQGSTQIQPLGTAHAVSWKRMVGFSSWTCASQSNCTSVVGGWHVHTQPSTGAFQLVSPVNHSPAGSCQLARFQLDVEEGAIGLYALDAAGGKRLSQVVIVSVADGQPHSVELRFHTGDSGSFKLVLANANAEPAVTTFTVFDPPEISDCP